MQKLFITTFCIFLTAAAFGQINKGAVLLGGNIGYFTVKYDEPGETKNEQKVFQFSPSIASAVKNNLAFGVDLTYAKLDYENTAMFRMEETKDVGGGVFLRQYQPLSTSFFIFGQARLGYINLDREYGSTINPNYRTTIEGTNINLSVMPGIAYKAGKRIFLELALNDLFKIELEETKTTNTSFGSPQVTKKNLFGISSSAGSVPLNIGMRFIFNK